MTYWVLGIAAALFAFMGVARSEPSGAASAASLSEQPEAKPAAASDEAEPTKPAASEPAPATQITGQCSEGRRQIEAYKALYQPARIRAMIALIPDPAESGHVDYFDSVLEGMEEAVAAGTAHARYVRDRHYVPWAGGAEAQKQRCWEREPGVLIYRPTANVAEQPTILVLLVGETPTWGLREAAFRAALELVKTHAPQPADANGFVAHEVLGPTFSGTAASLAAVLQSQAQKPGVKERFSVATGTATSPAVRSFLVKPSNVVPVEFASSVANDDELLCEMMKFIAARGGTVHERLVTNVALLGESLTQYGSVEEQTQELVRKQSRAKVCFAPGTLGKFPPNLASIRKAYGSHEKQLTVIRAPAEVSDANQEQRGELSEQTPIVHDLALAEVLGEFSEAKVRFIGIVATDARDTVFLAGRIRNQLPDVRLFTLGADNRFLHPSNTNAMNGMLVAHSVHTGRAGGAARSTALKSELTNNVFAAGRYLMAREPLKPRATVSLVGNGSLRRLSPTLAPAEVRPPIGWTFISACSLLVYALVLWLVAWPPFISECFARGYITSEQVGGFVRQKTYLWSLVGPCEHEDLRADDALVTAALLTIVGSPPLFMGVALYAHAGSAVNLRVVLFAAAVTACVVFFAWLRVPRMWANSSRSARTFSIFATSAGLLSLGIAFAPPREVTFYLLSGGSPIVGGLAGLGILAVGLWCWRVRLRFLDNHCFGVGRGSEGETDSERNLRTRPFSAIDPPIAMALGERAKTGSGLWEVERTLLDALRSPFRSFPLVVSLVHVLLGLTILTTIVIKTPHTFEPGFRNTILIGFGALCLLPVTMNFARLIITYIALMRVLRRIGRFPIHAAMADLPGELSRHLDAQLSLSRNDIGELTHAVALLGKLVAVGVVEDETYRNCKAMLDRELRSEAGPERRDDARAKLVYRLLRIAGEISNGTLKPSAPSELAEKLSKAFVAQLIATFIARYVRHFRLFLPPMLFGSVLGVLMNSLYFVQPHRLITSFTFVWVFAMVLVSFVVYVSIDRDPVISAMSHTRAGKVTMTWSLLGKIASWGILPLASVLAAQYPEFAYWVSTVVEVLAKALK